MQKLTTRSVVESLRAARDEYGPNWVDPIAAQLMERADEEDSTFPQSCEYVYEHGGTVRRCIGGEALHRHDVDDDTLAQYQGINAVGISFLLSKLGASFTDGAATLLVLAQTFQDNGMAWGDIVNWVELHVEETEDGDMVYTGPDWIETRAAKNELRAKGKSL
jgi:hypothetical protein